MTMTDWKPGDVADVVNEYGARNRAICAVRAGHRELVWSYGVADSSTPVKGSDARPLVVIDADAREQVERLASAWDNVAACDLGPVPLSLRALRMQAALREFAAPTPPKPEEPTVTGAVVVEADRLWVRTGWATWHCLSDPDVPPAYWGQFPDAVRVLSEGVTS